MEKLELQKSLFEALLPLTLEKFRISNTVGSLSEQIIDAHYLNLKEFKFALNMYYEQAKTSMEILGLDGFNLWVLIITGKGKHSEGGKGVLVHKIPKLLADLGLETYKLKDKQHSGCLYVRLVL